MGGNIDYGVISFVLLGRNDEITAYIDLQPNWKLPDTLYLTII